LFACVAAGGLTPCRSKWCEAPPCMRWRGLAWSRCTDPGSLRGLAFRVPVAGSRQTRWSLLVPLRFPRASRPPPCGDLRRLAPPCGGRSILRCESCLPLVCRLSATGVCLTRQMTRAQGLSATNFKEFRLCTGCPHSGRTYPRAGPVSHGLVHRSVHNPEAAWALSCCSVRRRTSRGRTPPCPRSRCG